MQRTACTYHHAAAWGEASGLPAMRTCRGAQLNHVQLGGEVAILEGLLREGDNRRRAVAAGNLDGGEGCRVSLQRLAALLLQGVQLHEALHQLWPAADFTSGASNVVMQHAHL